MKVLDLKNEYDEYLSHRSLEQYEEAYPALFEHYFSFWGNRDTFTTTLNKDEVSERVRLIKELLPDIEKSLEDNNLNSENLKLVLFVGQGCTNGHAFLDDDLFVVWIPVELYTTKIQVKSFLTHEIIHALHYGKNEDYYFRNKIEKSNPFRQLVTEGVATYVSKVIMNLSEEEALWADFLSDGEVKDWIDLCEKNKKEISKRVIHNEKTVTENIFEANDPKNIFNFRSGYYLALRVMESLAKARGLAVKELLYMSKKELDGYVEEYLEKYK